MHYRVRRCPNPLFIPMLAGSVHWGHSTLSVHLSPFLQVPAPITCTGTKTCTALTLPVICWARETALVSLSDVGQDNGSLSGLPSGIWDHSAVAYRCRILGSLATLCLTTYGTHRSALGAKAALRGHGVTGETLPWAHR